MLDRSLLDSPGYRIVVIYRISAERARLALPAGFALRTVNGSAFGGIALLCRTASPGNLFLPSRFIKGECVFHFVSAVRKRHDKSVTGAVVMRYDTSSRWHTLTGSGWRWSCRCRHARFQVTQSPDSISIRCDSDDQLMHVALDAHPRQEFPLRSIFRSKEQLLQVLQEDFVFLRLNRPRRRGLIRCTLCQSQLVPLQVTRIESTVFGNPQWFPDGAAAFDSAYWLRDDEVVWSEQGLVCCDMATI